MTWAIYQAILLSCLFSTLSVCTVLLSMKVVVELLKMLIVGMDKEPNR